MVIHTTNVMTHGEKGSRRELRNEKLGVWVVECFLILKRMYQVAKIPAITRKATVSNTT